MHVWVFGREPGGSDSATPAKQTRRFDVVEFAGRREKISGEFNIGRQDEQDTTFPVSCRDPRKSELLYQLTFLV